MAILQYGNMAPGFAPWVRMAEGAAPLSANLRIAYGLLVILEELKKSLLNNSFLWEASDEIFCIPMM